MLQIGNNNNNLSLSNNPVTVYMASLAKGSRRTVNQSLRIITEVSGRDSDILNYPWHELRYQHVQAIRTYLAEKYSYNTANKILAILKGVLKECKRLELMAVSDYDKAVDIKPIKGDSLLTGRYITDEEFAKLLEACNKNKSVLRDQAILYVLQVGLRRSEVSNLKSNNYNNQEGSILVTKAKRNKTRLVFLTAKGVEAINNYLLSASLNEYLFVDPDNNQGITDQSIYNIIKLACRNAGIPNLTVHDFRRTCASNLLSKGVDLVTVQKILGHESIETTARYDRRGIEAQKNAVHLLDI